MIMRLYLHNHMINIFLPLPEGGFLCGLAITPAFYWCLTRRADNVWTRAKEVIVIPRMLRVMLVGWGGNNGSTVTAGCLANKQ